MVLGSLLYKLSSPCASKDFPVNRTQAPPGPTLPCFALWAAPTFLFVRCLSLSGPPTPRQAEGALPGEAGAAGIEGGRDPTFLLPPLFPLQAGGKSTAHSVAQPLALWEEVGAGVRDAELCGLDITGPGLQQLGAG